MKRLFVLLSIVSVLFSERAAQIEYGGMTIYCAYECNEPSDPDRKDIDRIFSKCVKEVFRYCDALDKSLKSHWIDPWGIPGSEEECYDVWDWRSSKGFWSYNNGFPAKSYFLGTYSQFQEIANAMREDLHFYHVEWPQFAIQKYNSVISKLKDIDRRKYYRARIYDGGNKLDLEEYAWYEYDVNGNPHISPYQYDKTTIDDLIEDLESEILRVEGKLKDGGKYAEYSLIVEKALSRIEASYKRMFVFCLQNHQLEGAAFTTAIENLIMGEYERGIGQIQFLIDFAEDKKLGNELLSKFYLLKGELQSEFCLYADAVIGLTTAIQKDPLQKEAYLERAVAYFELGQFDKSIEDYLSYNPNQMDPKYRLEWRQIPSMSAGITAGIIKGGFGEAVEFLPEALSTAKGLGLGLWACVKNPVGASTAFVDAAQECIQYIKNHTCFEFLQDMVPELKELVQRYDEFSDFQRGEQIGLVIGKYGVDVLICNSSVKAVKAYRDLKRANQLMTLEVLTSIKHQQETLEASKRVWTKRQEYLQKVKKTSILEDKQGKHFKGHRNYQAGKSVWELSIEETQELINKFAGTGIKDSPAKPGTPGYKEIVDFKVRVGYVILEKTGEEIPTTWGKIHYSKDGVHVVPYLLGE